MKKEIELLIDCVFGKKPPGEQTTNALSRLGFSVPKSAFKNLFILSGHIDFKKLFPDFFPKLIHELVESFDPDRGLNNFERFSEKIFDKNYFYTILNNELWILNALVTLFSGSQILTDNLLKDPSLFDGLKEYETLNKSQERDILYRDLGWFLRKTHSYDEKLRVLRQFKKKEYLRIGLRDLMRKADVVETIKDISNLADVCLQSSCEFCEKELIKKFGTPVYVDAQGSKKKASFAVLGMGKLGGEELNFSSDIDLIYIYSSGEGKTTGLENNYSTIGSLTNHEFFSKLAAMVTDSMNKITSDGNVFRVDLGLRPEGQGGDIASSLQSCGIYYESWGQTWERLALIKARVSAGSEELGKKFDEIRQKFVYRKYLDFQAIDEIRESKTKIEKKLKGMGIFKDLKLGRGGIREIEFTVQVFQLIFGGRDSSIQERNTLKALQKIYEKKHLTENDYIGLKKAYRFLRDLENKVQFSFGLQKHSIPSEKEDLIVLAKKMGTMGRDRDNAAENLLKELQQHTQKVHEVFNALFKPEEKHDHKFDRVASPKDPVTDPFSLINQYPFKNKQQIIKNLKLLKDGERFSHPTARSRYLFEELIPDILQISSEQIGPDEAINNLEKFVRSFKSRETFFDLLKENTKMLELLLVLFGNSSFLSNILIRQPDLLDSLLDVESIYRFKPKEKMDMELKRFLKSKNNINEIKDVLRKFKKGEELRIGLRFLLKESNLENTFADLSLLAEVYLSNALNIAVEELTEKHGKPTIKDSEVKTHECGFSIIGMGKFGGYELDFGSDLDIVFVYEGEGWAEGKGNTPILNQEYFVKLITMIYDLSGSITSSGSAYKIDTDLRPEGKKGILTLPIDGFKKYFDERARVWERQSLTRARFIAGSEGLGKDFIDLAHNTAYKVRFEYGHPAEMHRLRMKMEDELGKETSKCKDAKVGYGGLVDIEFIVQLLQLKFGGKFSGLRSSRTLEVLKEAGRIGVLSTDHYNKLKESYHFLKGIINSIRIEEERSENKIFLMDEKLSKLALRLGYRNEQENKNREDFLKDYSFHTQQVRGIYRSFFLVEE